MKLNFDSNLDFQIDAINAVVDLFEGIPPKQGAFEISFGSQEGTLAFNELGVGHQLNLAGWPIALRCWGML